MRWCPLLVLWSSILLLAGCGGERDDSTIVTRTQAMADATPREMQVITVYDQVTDIMNPDHDENISHMIEVEILSGEGQGKHFVFPYDEWNTGRHPPAVGARVVCAPADWVKRDPDSHGKPFEDWQVKH